MQKILEIIQRKPPVHVLASLVYLLALGFLKWQLKPPPDALLFIGGGLLGIYFLDIAEVFFHLSPSPFRGVVFVGIFVIVSLFVVTSSTSYFARGLVLTMYLTLILLQVDEWRSKGNLASWYKMVSGSVSIPTQQLVLGGFSIIFLLVTYFFIR